MLSSQPRPCSVEDNDDSEQGDEKNKKKEKEDKKECLYRNVKTFIALTEFRQYSKHFIYFNLLNPLRNPLW